MEFYELSSFNGNYDNRMWVPQSEEGENTYTINTEERTTMNYTNLKAFQIYLTNDNEF